MEKEEKKSRRLTQKSLDEIIRRHEMWLDSDGEAGEQADLSCTDLSGLNLANANLRGANLFGARLKGANLTNANLREANLGCSYLEGANLADINLKHADLRIANLEGANLTRANMKFADLARANLGHADLTFADLKDANLKLADLTGVNLTNVKNLPDISMVCPETGLIICWKKALGGFIIKLEIPEDAKRSSAIGSRKCRCNKAKVLSIENLDGTPAEVTSVQSKHYPDFIYKVGETVEVPDFDENRFIECSNGIHFFMTRGEAFAY